VQWSPATLQTANVKRQRSVHIKTANFSHNVFADGCAQVGIGRLGKILPHFQVGTDEVLDLALQFLDLCFNWPSVCPRALAVGHRRPAAGEAVHAARFFKFSKTLLNAARVCESERIQCRRLAPANQQDEQQH